MNILDAFNNFLVYLRLHKWRSRKTQEQYAFHIWRFIGWLEPKIAKILESHLPGNSETTQVSVSIFLQPTDPSRFLIVDYRPKQWMHIWLRCDLGSSFLKKKKLIVSIQPRSILWKQTIVKWHFWHKRRLRIFLQVLIGKRLEGSAILLFVNVFIRLGCVFLSSQVLIKMM